MALAAAKPASKSNWYWRRQRRSVPSRDWAGIPPTFRGLADGFADVTGHLRNEADQVDWSKYAAVDTLIILMGVRTRVSIAKELIRHGRPSDQPIAFIERGATPEERVVTATLREVAEGLVEVENPAVFVAGEVVRLRPFLCETARQFAPDYDTCQ